jgi:hypothetical protein
LTPFDYGAVMQFPLGPTTLPFGQPVKRFLLGIQPASAGVEVSMTSNMKPANAAIATSLIFASPGMQLR